MSAAKIFGYPGLGRPPRKERSVWPVSGKHPPLHLWPRPRHHAWPAHLALDESRLHDPVISGATDRIQLFRSERAGYAQAT